MEKGRGKRKRVKSGGERNPRHGDAVEMIRLLFIDRFI